MHTTPDILAQLDTQAILAERCLVDFIRQSWPVIEPGTAYLHNWHVDVIAEYLEAVSAGEITRLVINMPPRYMKSIAVTVAWPVWTWIHHPESRWLFSSYSGLLSTKHSVDRRTIIQSNWFQRRWADRFQLTSDQNVKTEYVNNKRGHMVSTSYGGSATGKGGNFIVVDDPHNPEEVLSDTIRDGHIRFFDQTLSTRLDDKKRGAIVLVMQRLHEKDLSGHLLASGDYVHLCLPAEVKTRTIVQLPSGKRKIRQPGDILWEERENAKDLAQARRQLGSYGYAAQYDQTPAPRGGGLFKSAWIRRWKLSDDGSRYLLEKHDGTYRSVSVDECQRVVTMDIAGTEKQQGTDPDYSVLQVWDVTPTYDAILVHQWRDRCETPDTADIAVRKCRTYDVLVVLVERNGIGLAVVQTMRRKGIAVRGIHVHKSKEVRSQTAQIRMEAGTMFFPLHASWWQEMEAELTRFPKGAHDDQVDPMSLLAQHVQRIGGPVTDEQEEKDASSLDAQRRQVEHEEEQEKAAQRGERRRVDIQPVLQTSVDVDDERGWQSM